MVTLLILFVTIKLINHRLHDMFDHGEVVNKKTIVSEIPDSTDQVRVEEDIEQQQDNLYEDILNDAVSLPTAATTRLLWNFFD